MIKFGTGGWRAVIGDEFTKANIQLLSKAMVLKMKAEGVEDKGIVMGYDRRFLSKESMQWAATVFAKEGIKSRLINKSAPTPLVMYYVMKYELPYGMMITASHNPAIYNGIKVFTTGGRDADELATASIEEYIAKAEETEVEDMDYADAVNKGLIEEIYPLNEYIDAILDTVDVDAIRKASLKVAFDPMYGVSDTSIKTILLTTRCEVEAIHERHDTLFGGKLPAPNESTLSLLKHYTLEKKCDIGIATDGDADRIGVIDDKGNFLHPNDILVLLYYYLVKYKGMKGDCVRNICTTHLLDRVAEEFGYQCHEVPVGFKHISAKMYEKNAIIGGESSGGMALKGHIKGKDGVYVTALLLEMLALTGMKLSELMDHVRKEYGGMALAEKDFRFSPARKEEIKNLLLEKKLLPEIPYEVSKVSYLDGLKIYLKAGGWISVRFSGTEPLLRIFCEMPAKDEAEEFCKVFEDFLDLIN
ncbi:MAG: phosphoglucomutase/phosphomannomutase family protein [Pseudobutyrivibrio sp.]|nr:phosphoglucomutase/phosphomannomutase family protein [Pseudobutyrivibrio sp.]MCF0185324.1 phosphoglucomutase/phosphomannomutase family protein [Bacteroidaceae bacterium]